MPLSLFTGTSNPALAAAIAARLGVNLGRAEVSRFPDGELRVELRDRGNNDRLMSAILARVAPAPEPS